MPSTKEIKSHIESVKETRKITNAMYLIASAKLRRARSDLEQTRSYFEALRGEVKRIFRTVNDVDNRYFYPPGRTTPLEGTYGCLDITADKGMAGAYTQNVVKETKKLLSQHSDTRLFVVGEYGRHYLGQHGIPIEQSFRYSAQRPTLARAREICSILLDGFDSGELSQIFVIYTDTKNGLVSQPRSTRLLPFHRKQFAPRPEEKAVDDPFEFVPSVTEVLDRIMPSYISGFIYSALVDSFCSEQSERMAAMNTANKNAENLLGELSLEYNRVRQAAITQEITEVSAGASAQRRANRKDV